MVNEDFQPSDAEEDVLDVLKAEWRANPYLLREETGHGKGAVNTALTRLTSAGWVRKVTRGLYEFVDDPRETSESPSEPETESESGSGDAGTIEDALAGWRHGRYEEEREASQEIAEQATEWLRETELPKVSKADVPLEDLAYGDREGRDPNTLWTEVIRDAWRHAADQGYVEQPNSRAYRWTGGERDA